MLNFHCSGSGLLLLATQHLWVMDLVFPDVCREHRSSSLSNMALSSYNFNSFLLLGSLWRAFIILWCQLGFAIWVTTGWFGALVSHYYSMWSHTICGQCIYCDIRGLCYRWTMPGFLLLDYCPRSLDCSRPIYLVALCLYQIEIYYACLFY